MCRVLKEQPTLLKHFSVALSEGICWKIRWNNLAREFLLLKSFWILVVFIKNTLYLSGNKTFSTKAKWRFVSQIILSTEDENSNCVDYPTDTFASYSDCDEHFMRKTLPKNLIPFWTVRNINESSNNYNSEKLDYKIWADLGDKAFIFTFPF